MATTATLRRNGKATATVMDGDGWCNGNATATTAIERGGDGRWHPDERWVAPRHACTLRPGICAPQAVVLWVQVQRHPPLLAGRLHLCPPPPDPERA